MQRQVLGWCALAAFGIAGSIAFWGDLRDPRMAFWGSVSFRLGLMLAAVWLAFPKLRALRQRLSPALLPFLALVLAALVIRPRVALWVVPLLVILGVLAWLRRFLAEP